jgi:hypothetical protein
MTIKQILLHGKILDRPARQPQDTRNNVAYELGKSFQLDQRHALLVASMDEQGGGDLCVGNDGFIFEKISEIAPEKAIPINFPDPDYKLRNAPGRAFLAKYPVTGGFVPLGATLDDGRPHPAAGTGILVSDAVTFSLDKTSADSSSETIMEFIQLRWDGRSLKIQDKTLIDQALSYKISGTPLSYFCPQGPDFIAPFVTDQGIIIFRFAFDGQSWQIASAGRPFVTLTTADWLYKIGESEPSIQKQKDRFLVYTRGADFKGRLYQSFDGMDFKLLLEKPNASVPQALNQGLDGSLYLATNPNRNILRNPLVAYPLINDSFGDPLTIHDEDGIQDDKGPKIPFIDHAVSVNLVLENHPRHLLWYRVCDLKERTFHRHQADLEKLFYMDGKPQPRSTTTGLYLAEFVY